MSENESEQVVPSGRNSALAWKAYDLAMKYEGLEMSTWFSNQADWRHSKASLSSLTQPGCGTTACLAGWVEAVKGNTLWMSVKDGYMTYVITPDGENLGMISDVAQESLGLTFDEAGVLFTETTNEDIEQRLVDYFGPRPGGDDE